MVFIFRRIWEKEISETLNERSNRLSNYVILRSGQLVGTALVIYAKAEIVSNIRNVEYVMKKVGFLFSSFVQVILDIYIWNFCFQTGLGGMAGNKGAVAIRLDYHDTSMCFVTAHFAAGKICWISPCLFIANNYSNNLY